MIISQKLPNCHVFLVGLQPRNEYPQALPSGMLSPQRCYVQVASDPSKVGFQSIVRWQANAPAQPVFGDGVLVDHVHASVLFHTADCPTVVIDNPETGNTVAVHAGRPALTPDQAGRNIITRALMEILSGGGSAAALTVYITGSICGEHFSHDHEGKREQALPFLDAFGPEVFFEVETLALDLVSVIILQLVQAGIPETNITHDGICTYETEGLASHRRDGRDRVTTNLVVVTTR